MATILWSTLADGSTIAFNAATDILSFDDGSISAGDRNMITWTGSDVIFSVGDKANAALNKTVHFTITDGGRALTDGNVTYLNGSKLLIGDNTQNIGNGSSTFDDAANSLTGTAFGDRFFGLGGQRHAARRSGRRRPERRRGLRLRRLFQRHDRGDGRSEQPLEQHG